MQSPLPPVIHTLKALSRLLERAGSFCAQRKIAPSVLLGDRLFPDMLPLVRQVQIATDHAKAIGARLAGIENPKYEDDEVDFVQLEERIAKVIAFLSEIPAEAFTAAEEREIILAAGTPREMKFPGAQYLPYYAIPNFYFHVVTSYNILRHNGVEVGKTDFLGADKDG